jgi:predicted Zn-dependent protease with MMP-like domain
MSLKQFCQVVAGVMNELPTELKEHLHNVTVDVEEEPDDETLRSVGLTDEEIEAGDSIYGVFEPMPLPGHWAAEAVDVHDLPHRIVIYRRPLEEDFPDLDELRTQIRKTVIHELAHHFGYSDRDLERWSSVY